MGMDAFDNFAFREACKLGDLTAVVALLQDPSVDVTARNSQGLVQAAANGHTQIVKLLLNDGRSSRTNLPVIMTIVNNHYETFRELIKHKPYKNLEPFIYYAVSHKRVEIIDIILKRDIKNVPDVLEAVAKTKNISMIQTIFEKNVNIIDDGNLLKFLLVGIEKKSEPLVMLILKNNKTNSSEDESSSSSSSESESESTVLSKLSKDEFQNLLGTSQAVRHYVWFKTNSGRISEQFRSAVYNNDVFLAKLILEHDDSSNVDLLKNSVRHKHYEMVELLLRQVRLDVSDKDKVSFCISFAIGNKPALLKQLLGTNEDFEINCFIKAAHGTLTESDVHTVVDLQMILDIAIHCENHDNIKMVMKRMDTGIIFQMMEKSKFDFPKSVYNTMMKILIDKDDGDYDDVREIDLLIASRMIDDFDKLTPKRINKIIMHLDTDISIDSLIKVFPHIHLEGLNYLLRKLHEYSCGFPGYQPKLYKLILSNPNITIPSGILRQWEPDILRCFVNDSRVNPAEDNNKIIRDYAGSKKVSCVRVLMSDPRVDPTAALDEMYWSDNKELYETLLRSERCRFYVTENCNKNFEKYIAEMYKQYNILVEIGKKLFKNIRHDENMLRGIFSYSEALYRLTPNADDPPDIILNKFISSVKE